MKLGDKVILFGFIDGCSYETTGQTNFIIALETGERVEIPFGGAINVDDMTLKDNIKLKDVIARIKKLDLNTQKVWLDGILKELGDDYGSMKYREGYEQGKLEGSWVGNQLKDADKIRQELNRVKVHQCVADWYEINKDNLDKNIVYLCLNWEKSINDNNFFNWMSNTDNFIQILVNMHQFGYEVEKEKRYVVKVKGNIKENMLVYGEFVKRYFFTKNSSVFNVRYSHTRKELEDAGFGWVFDCEGIEIEEVPE